MRWLREYQKEMDVDRWSSVTFQCSESCLGCGQQYVVHSAMYVKSAGSQEDSLDLAYDVVLWTR